jgi:hypothetical protein
MGTVAKAWRSDYVSDPIDITLASEGEALNFGKYIGGEMLERMPDLDRKG